RTLIRDAALAIANRRGAAARRQPCSRSCAETGDARKTFGHGRPSCTVASTLAKEVTVMECKGRIEGYLRDNHVRFETQHHALAMTAQHVADSEHIPGKLLAKVVLFVADGKTAMLTLPASHRVDLPRAAAMLGAQKEARLADEAELAAAFPDCEVGAM